MLEAAEISRQAQEEEVRFELAVIAPLGQSRLTFFLHSNVTRRLYIVPCAQSNKKHRKFATVCKNVEFSLLVTNFAKKQFFCARRKGEKRVRW